MLNLDNVELVKKTDALGMLDLTMGYQSSLQKA